MKATLEFNLPEEEPELRDAMNGTLWRGALMAVEETLRSRLKHGHAYITPDEAIESIKATLQAELEVRGLDPFSA